MDSRFSVQTTTFFTDLVKVGRNYRGRGVIGYHIFDGPFFKLVLPFPTCPSTHLRSNILWKIKCAFSIIVSDVSNALYSAFHLRRTLYLHADDKLSYYTRNVLLKVYFEPQILGDDVIQ